MSDERCLNCDQTRAQIKSRNSFCATVSGFEYPEIDAEWSRHRWADWNDAELKRFGIKPEAYDKHRRTQGDKFQWVGCEDTVRGHTLATRESDREDFGAKIGQCIACGWKPDADDL
ncbi:MAG: hypothetical protein ACTHKE_04260 [Sphingomicrobium sp.]